MVTDTPRSPKKGRTILFAAFAALFVATAAHAVSLYDIVQLSKAGYSDRAIVDLIHKTNSRFYVDAETIVALKKDGVRQPVIRAILEARTDEKPQEEQPPPDASTSSAQSRDHEGGPARAQPEHDREVRNPAPVADPHPEADLDTNHHHDEQPAATATREAFSVFPFEEGPSSGHVHASDHVHYAIGIAGVPLMVVRSEAGHANVVTRANEIAEAFNRAVSGEDGSFVASATSSGAGVWFQPSSGGKPTLVLPVSRGDVIAWQRRSLGSVSAQRLASYWAALLNDFTRVFIRHQPPTAIADLHLGDSLQSIYRELISETKSRDNQSIPRIVDHLSAEEKDHLLELASRVPAEFESQRRAQ